jgi:hypothetical protein
MQNLKRHRATAGADQEWVAALTEAAHASMNVSSMAGVRGRLDATLESFGHTRAQFSDDVLAMVVSGACGLPLALVKELL